MSLTTKSRHRQRAVACGLMAVAAWGAICCPAAADRRQGDGALNTTEPYPAARLHQDWIYQDFGPDVQVFDQGGAEARRRFEQMWLDLLEAPVPAPLSAKPD